MVVIKNNEGFEFEIDDENYLLNSLKNVKINESYEVQSIIFHQLANEKPLIDVIKYYENIIEFKKDIDIESVGSEEN